MHHCGVFLEGRTRSRQTNRVTNHKVVFKLGPGASKLLTLSKTVTDLGFKKLSPLKIRYTTPDTELQTRYNSPTKVLALFSFEIKRERTTYGYVQNTHHKDMFDLMVGRVKVL
jgi:hypothetical protein